MSRLQRDVRATWPTIHLHVLACMPDHFDRAINKVCVNKIVVLKTYEGRQS